MYCSTQYKFLVEKDCPLLPASYQQASPEGGGCRPWGARALCSSLQVAVPYEHWLPSPPRAVPEGTATPLECVCFLKSLWEAVMLRATQL